MIQIQSAGSFAFRNIQQSPDKFYKVRSQPKMKFGSPQIDKNGAQRMRDITKPNFSLKIIQREINRQLKEFDLPDCMYGGVKGRNNFGNAYQHINSKYFLTIDLKKFFNNITNSQVHQTLISNGFTWTEARCITNLTTYKGCLPQGAPTSTTLANLVFAPTAAYLAEFCKEREITFTVFVDDLTFSSSRCFLKHINLILGILQHNKFFVNHKKIRYRRNCSEITGIIVRRGEIFLPKEILNHRNKTGVKEYIADIAKQYDATKTAINQTFKFNNLT